MTLGEALAAARGRIDRLDARLLLQFATGCSHSDLLVRPETPVFAPALAQYLEWVERRAAGEPFAYLVGEAEFRGRVFQVSPDVLIPRPETELLIELALQRLQAWPVGRPPRIVDLGTGSGIAAISLALECPQAEVVAVDLSPGALAVARNNAGRLGACVDFRAGSWFAPLAGECFDLIVSNPPYIAAGDPHLAEGDVRFEPAGALASGVAGLDDLARITATAPAFLVPGGWLMMEHGYDQAAAVRGLLREAGFDSVTSAQDLAGIERVSLGCWPRS